MPLLDSFKVDHTIMPAPAVRLAKTMQTPKGDTISVYDLRFCVPNAVEIIDISPMGCRTGFYMSLIGKPDDESVKNAWSASMKDILNASQIPEANKFQCGTYAMHSLDEAKAIAKSVLDKGIGIMDTNKILLKEFA